MEGNVVFITCFNMVAFCDNTIKTDINIMLNQIEKQYPIVQKSE